MTAKFAALMILASGLVAGPAMAQDGDLIPADKQLPGKAAGSVKPDITMEDQILPCLDGGGSGPRVLLKVKGLTDNDGNVRVQIYGENPEDFLEKGKRLIRIDVPTQKKGMKVCVSFPEPGTYAMVVMHDRNANGRADIATEGFGFSRNPRLLFSQPDHDEVAFEVTDGLTEMTVDLTYMFRSVRNSGDRPRARR